MRYVAAAGGILFAGSFFDDLVSPYVPRWWFDWNSSSSGSAAGVSVYLALMDDQYPSTDEHQSVHLEYPYPNAETDLNQWLPLVKWLLAIPHYIVLFFLDIAAVIAVIDMLVCQISLPDGTPDNSSISSKGCSAGTIACLRTPSSW